MYKFANLESTLVTDLETGVTNISPSVSQWEKYEAWVAGGGVTEPFMTLIGKQRSMRSLIKTFAYGRREGGLNVNTYWLQSDIDSRLRYFALMDEVRIMRLTGALDTTSVVIDSAPATWFTLDDVEIPITCKRVELILAALKVLDQRLIRVTKYHVNQMLQAADPFAYDFSAGWPPVFGG